MAKENVKEQLRSLLMTTRSLETHLEMLQTQGLLKEIKTEKAHLQQIKKSIETINELLGY